MGGRGLFRAVFLALLGAGATTGSAVDLLPKSVSRSHQFVVYAADGAMRNAVGTLGEEIKSGMLDALSLRDEWKLPIVVDLRYPDAGNPGARPPSQLSLGQTGAGLKVELDLLLGEAGRGNRIRDEMVRAILLEMGYREYARLPAGQTYNMPPAWLVQGFSAYLENQEDGVAASMFAALLPTSQTLSLEDFLNRNPDALDSTSRAVYRAYAFTLVRLLVQELPGGKAGLAKYISDLSGMGMESDRGAGALRSHFPDLAETNDSLDKWWTLSLARLASSDSYQAFTIEESDKRLTDSLTFQGPAKTGKGGVSRTYTLADYRDFLSLKNGKRLLEPVRQALVGLSARANPLEQPIVGQYQVIVAMLMRGKTKGVDEQLKSLADLRVKALERKSSIDDYLNWYEATQLTSTSGAFESYFRAAKQQSASRSAHRPDPVSTYLDGLEMEFK